jgi:hypothetical protein
MKIAKITFEGTPAEFQIEDVRALFATASQPTAERVLTGKAVEAAEEDDVLTEDVAANVLTRLDLSRSRRHQSDLEGGKQKALPRRRCPRPPV